MPEKKPILLIIENQKRHFKLKKKSPDCLDCCKTCTYSGCQTTRPVDNSPVWQHDWLVRQLDRFTATSVRQLDRVPRRETDEWPTYVQHAQSDQKVDLSYGWKPYQPSSCLVRLSWCLKDELSELPNMGKWLHHKTAFDLGFPL